MKKESYVCVEKNERATDSRIKSGIQNLLGGMVLGALPVVLTGVFLMWDSLGTVTNNQQYLLKRVDALEKWREETNGNRFRWADGELLRQAIAGNTQDMQRLKESVTEHNRNAEKWIEKILQMEKRSHYHNWQVESDK